MRILAYTLSVVFHPLFLVVYAFMLQRYYNPYMFGSGILQRFDFYLIYFSVLTALLPTVAMLVMRGLGFIETMEMRTGDERVGPLIATGILYIWMFLNVQHLDGMPDIFKFFVLGATLGLFAAFFINLFTKISLHSIGMGGLVGMLFLFYLFYSFDDLSWLLLAGIVAAGAVGTARLYLKAHEPNEVYGGLLVGFVAQFLAFKIIV